MAEHGSLRTVSKIITTDGHDIDISFIVENVSATKLWAAQQTYHTNCGVLPTSLFFQVVFRQETENDTISCFIKLRRHDLNFGRAVKVFIWMSFFDAGGQFLRFPIKLSNDQMLPEDEIIEYNPHCIPLGELVNLPEQKLLVDVVIFIRCCHMIEDGTDCVANLVGDMSNMSVS